MAMLNKNIVGLVCVAAQNSKWNSDFDGELKRTSSGTVYGSDKSLKYAYRDFWYKLDLKVFLYRTFIEDKKNGIMVKTINQRCEEMFAADGIKKHSTIDIAKNLFKAVDVRQFGVVGAISGEDKGVNLPLTGCVQFGQGMNKYDNTKVTDSTILSPFSVKGSANATLGEMSFADEAHYVYPFSINPITNKRYIDLGYTEGYTEEDYELFKDASLQCVNHLHSVAKMGCFNELSVFVELEKGTMLQPLDSFVSFKKVDGQSVYDLNFAPILDMLGDRVLSVELYYNPLSTVVNCNSSKVKRLNILTKEEIK